MKVVILCGGLGTRLREETEYKPKPMVEVAGKPILWHVMKTYAHYGYTDFVLCLGYKGDVIRDYFYHYETRNSDFTIELGTRNIVTHGFPPEKGWRVTLAETGKSAMTGARVKRVERYLDDDVFLLTYGDGVCDVNIRELVDFHRRHGKMGTVTGVLPPSRFGELLVDQSAVVQFDEKPQMHGGGMINGGYFVFNCTFLQYLSDRDGCILEREPMERLVKDGQLEAFRHKGFWQCMDTYRDMEYLNGLWAKGAAAWKVWDGE